MFDKCGFGRRMNGTGKYTFKNVPRKAMTRNHIRSIFLIAFVLVAALIATRPAAAQDAARGQACRRIIGS